MKDILGGFKKIDIGSGTIFRTVLIVIGFWFLYLIIDLLLMIFASVVIASAIIPIADKLGKYRIPRAVSVVLVYGLVIGIVSLVITVILAPLTDQVTQLAGALPQLAEEVNFTGLLSADQINALVGSWQQTLVGAGDNLANIGANVFKQTRTVFSAAFTLFFVFVIAFYLTIDKDAFKKPFRLMVSPKHIPYVEMIVERAQKKIGRWVVAQLALAVIIGVVVWLGLWLLGVPYALVLGLLSGLFEVFPIIGPVIAAVPGVIVASSQSLVLGAGVLVFYILVQQAENTLLIPAIMKRATGLNPLITILAVLLGARLAGLVGIMLSVPVAVVLSTFVSDFITTSESKEEPA